jgi:hypothetical protein
MAGKFCNEGRVEMSDIYIENGTPRSADSWYLGLYTDTTEPAITDTLATITELPVANGYARINILDSQWTNVVGVVTAALKTFTNTTANWGNVYGYFLTDVASGTSGNLHWVEHFSTGPFNVSVGQTVDVTAEITLAT